jgi:hypothetical protein
MSFLLCALGLGKGKSVFQNTEEQIFVALLKSWGFKLTKKFTADFDTEKRYFKERQNGCTLYTMSGGPMVMFERKTGKFMEWC